jgi:predicted acetyltransferase
VSAAAQAVELIAAWRDPDAQAFFRNVWPMYLHEIMGYDSSFYRLDGSGRWQPDVVEDWLAAVTPAANLRVERSGQDAGQPFQRTHVIACDGRAVGFVCLGLPPFRFMPEQDEVSLFELFLSRDVRRRGVARAAVERVLALHPGRWSLAAIHDNTRAIAFWSKTLPELGVRELRREDEHGDVVWRFVAGAVAGTATG